MKLSKTSREDFEIIPTFFFGKNISTIITHKLFRAFYVGTQILSSIRLMNALSIMMFSFLRYAGLCVILR